MLKSNRHIEWVQDPSVAMALVTVHCITNDDVAVVETAVSLQYNGLFTFPDPDSDSD